MNRRDYRAHVEWAEGIRAARADAPAVPVHHTRRPAPMRPRRRWAVIAALLAVVGGGA